MSVPISKVTRERHLAVVGRLRVHVDHALDAVDLLLDDGGDRIGDGHGVGAGVARVTAIVGGTISGNWATGSVR